MCALTKVWTKFAIVFPYLKPTGFNRHSNYRTQFKIVATNQVTPSSRHFCWLSLPLFYFLFQELEPSLLSLSLDLYPTLFYPLQWKIRHNCSATQEACTVVILSIYEILIEFFIFLSFAIPLKKVYPTTNHNHIQYRP